MAKRPEYFRVQSTAQGLQLDSDASGLTYRKELIYANAPGEFFTKRTKDKVQKFRVDESTLDHWASVGNRMRQNGVKIPTPLKHNTDPENNRGQILRFETGVNDEGRPALFGIVKFRDEKAAELAASTDVSIFVPADPIYDGKGNGYDYAIQHVCFTDYPVIPGLSGFQAIAASLDTEPLELSAIDIGKQIGKNVVRRVRILGRKAVRDNVRYAKKHKVLTAAGAYSTGDFIDSRIRGNEHKTIQPGDGVLKRGLKHAHNAATLGSAGVIGVHGVKELGSAFKGGKPVGRIIKAGIGAKSVAYAGHAAEDIAHRTKGHKAKALSLENAPKRKSEKLGIGARAAYGLAGAVSASTVSGNIAALSNVATTIALKHKYKIPYTLKEVALLTKVGGLNALLAMVGLPLSAILIGRAITGRQPVAASNDAEAEQRVRDHNGRFAKVPGSKWSQRQERTQDRSAARTQRAISGYRPGVGKAPPTKAGILPTKKGLYDYAAEHVHDFYTADASELGRGHNAAHALKHGALAAPTAGLAYLASKGVGKAAKAVFRWRKSDETAKNAIKNMLTGAKGTKGTLAALGKAIPHAEKIFKGRAAPITGAVVAGSALAAAIGATAAQLRASQLHAKEAFRKKK